VTEYGNGKREVADWQSEGTVEVASHSRLHLVPRLVKHPLPRFPGRSMPSMIRYRPRGKLVDLQCPADCCYQKSERMSDGDESGGTLIAAWIKVFETALMITVAVCRRLWALLR
jgi:hypothetical protein